jgi:hypothetical protein
MKTDLYDIFVKHEGEKCNVVLLMKDQNGGYHSIDLGIYFDGRDNKFPKEMLQKIEVPFEDLTAENLDSLDKPIQQTGVNFKASYELRFGKNGNPYIKSKLAG